MKSEIRVPAQSKLFSRHQNFPWKVKSTTQMDSVSELVEFT